MVVAVKCVLLYGRGLLDDDSERRVGEDGSLESIDQLASLGVCGLLATNATGATGEAGKEAKSVEGEDEIDIRIGDDPFLAEFERGRELAPRLRVRTIRVAEGSACPDDISRFVDAAPPEEVDVLLVVCEDWRTLNAFAAVVTRNGGSEQDPSERETTDGDKAGAEAFPAAADPRAAGDGTFLIPIAVASFSAAHARRCGGSGSDARGGGGDIPSGHVAESPSSRGGDRRPPGCPTPVQSWTLAGGAGQVQEKGKGKGMGEAGGEDDGDRRRVASFVGPGRVSHPCIAARAVEGLARRDAVRSFTFGDVRRNGADGLSHVRFLPREIAFWCDRYPKYGA